MCLWYALYMRLRHGGRIERGWSTIVPWVPRFYWVSNGWRYAYVPKYPMKPIPWHILLYRGRVIKKKQSYYSPGGLL